MATIDVLIMIHGIVPQKKPANHNFRYNQFYQNMLSYQPKLEDLRRIHVEYGHLLKPGPAQADHQKLTQVQSRVEEKVMGMGGVETLPFWWDPPSLISTSIFPLMIHGIGDAIYYCSAEGEQAIRKAVYDQIIGQLRELLITYERARIHIVSHSLGVTVAHDFLYTLFKPKDSGHTEYCSAPYGDHECVQFLMEEREKDNRRIELGSYVTLCSQLPLFIMRKQSLIDKIYNEERLELPNIGINNNQVTWLSFFDKDDILAYASNWLYNHQGEIVERQVESGGTVSAHEGIWNNKRVIKDSAAHIAAMM